MQFDFRLLNFKSGLARVNLTPFKARTCLDLKYFTVVLDIFLLFCVPCFIIIIIWKYWRDKGKYIFLHAVLENGNIFCAPFRTIQFSGFGFEGLSVFIWYARARAHANLYIDQHTRFKHSKTNKEVIFF